MSDHPDVGCGKDLSSLRPLDQLRLLGLQIANESLADGFKDMFGQQAVHDARCIGPACPFANPAPAR